MKQQQAEKQKATITIRIKRIETLETTITVTTENKKAACECCPIRKRQSPVTE